jgi:S1-C subfamily serine protease
MPQSIANVVEAVRPSFVNILVKGIVAPESGQAGSRVPHMTDIVGSGVIVDPSGIIFTNNHVVDNGMNSGSNYRMEQSSRRDCSGRESSSMSL